jgi:hypothetical protein
MRIIEKCAIFVRSTCLGRLHARTFFKHTRVSSKKKGNIESKYKLSVQEEENRNHHLLLGEEEEEERRLLMESAKKMMINRSITNAKKTLVHDLTPSRHIRGLLKRLISSE